MALNHTEKKIARIRYLNICTENVTNNALISLFSATLISLSSIRVQFIYGFVKKKTASKMGFLENISGKRFQSDKWTKKRSF